MTRLHSGRMTEGGILPSILRYSLPLIAGNFLQQLYNTADSVIVGNLVGDAALAAVGTAGQIAGLLFTVCLGAGAGAGVLVAMYYGAEDREKTDSAVHNAAALSLLGGGALMLLGLAGGPLFLRWMGTPEEVLRPAWIYLRILFAGTLCTALYNYAAGVLNAVGASSRSLLYLAVASGANIALDLLLVGAFRLGVAGTAWATVFAQLLSAALALRYLTRLDDICRLSLRRIRLEKRMALRILRLGIPTAIQGAVISFSNVLIQSSVNSFGTRAMAGFTSYMKVDGFNILPVSSFSLAASTFVGQNLGAGRVDRARRGTWTVLLLSLGYTAVMSVVMLTFSKPILSLFGGDEETLRSGILCLRALAPFYALLAVIHSLAGAVRGSGHTAAPMVIILFSLCLCRMVWIALAAPRFGSIWGVYLTYPVSFVIGASLMVLYTLRARWLEPAEKKL